MGKLYFRYGAMGSSKTANLLMVHYNFLERGRRPVILKPKLDTRDGEYIVKSRIGLQAKCELIEEFTMKPDTYDAILVDEANFLSSEQVEWLAEICDQYDIPVLCYGLKTDFRGVLFEGSKRLCGDGQSGLQDDDACDYPRGGPGPVRHGTGDGRRQAGLV